MNTAYCHLLMVVCRASSGHPPAEAVHNAEAVCGAVAVPRTGAVYRAGQTIYRAEASSGRGRSRPSGASQLWSQPQWQAQRPLGSVCWAWRPPRRFYQTRCPPWCIWWARRPPQWVDVLNVCILDAGVLFDWTWVTDEKSRVVSINSYRILILKLTQWNGFANIVFLQKKNCHLP